MPRDADLNFNLRHTRNQLIDAVPDSRGLLDTTFFWLEPLRVGEVFWCFALVNALFWGILLLRLFSAAEWTFYAGVILLIFWVMTGTSFWVKQYQVVSDDRAVIVEKEAGIRAGPDSGDTVLFKLHEGSVVHYERSEDGWCLVSLADKKKRGWVRAESVEPIAEGP